MAERGKMFSEFIDCIVLLSSYRNLTRCVSRSRSVDRNIQSPHSYKSLRMSRKLIVRSKLKMKQILSLDCDPMDSSYLCQNMQLETFYVH